MSDHLDGFREDAPARPETRVLPAAADRRCSRREGRFCALVLALYGLGACGCAATRPNPDNSPGRPSTYEAVNEIGPNSGIGIESQDIVAATNAMARDMLADPEVAGAPGRPRVIIDDKYFLNEGTSNLNKKLFTDRLRVELGRASEGRILFVSRENVSMAEDEREFRKTDGVQTMEGAGAIQGADYRLSGRIMTLDKIDPRSGLTTRYHQILFELINLETTIIDWNNVYEFRKSAADDQIYR